MDQRAELRRRGKRWRVLAVGQGKATAIVGTLGDGKRAAEALVQHWLMWERVNERRWTGRMPTPEEKARAARASG